MPTEMKILNGIDVETVLKSLPQGDHVNAMWFYNAAAAIESALLAKLTAGVEVPDIDASTLWDHLLAWHQSKSEECEKHADAAEEVIVRLMQQYGALQRLAGREQAIEECAKVCDLREQHVAELLTEQLKGAAVDSAKWFSSGVVSASKRNAQHIRALAASPQGQKL